MNSTTPTTRRLPWLLASSLLSALVAVGQTAPAEKDKDADVVKLSPYAVNTSSEKGYYSPEAVSGTRTRTELVNLPLNLAVFNENFINDIGARDLVDIVSFASGVAGGSTAGSDNAGGDTLGFILRGQGGFVPNRNGFRRLRLVDPVTISRVEVLKGPSSVLYGQASPGGSVNYITKRPVQHAIFSTNLRVGSYEFYKASVDVNVPSENKQVAMRFVGSYEDSQSWIARYHKKQRVYYPSLTWWIRPETTLTVEFERTVELQNPQAPLPFHPYLDPDVPGNLGAVDLHFNTRGLDDFFNVTMEAFTAELVHKFNDHLTLRANWTDESWVDDTRLNSASTTIVSLPTGFPPTTPASSGPPSNPPTLPGRAFSRGSRGSFDSYRQVELLNNFTWHDIAVQNLLGYQHGHEEFKQIYAGIAPPIDNSSLWNLNDPRTWILTERLDELGSAASTGQHFANIIRSGYFVNQLTLLGDKVHTLVGVRYDKIDADNLANANSAAPVKSTFSVPGKYSPQVGVLFKPIPTMAFFANYSTSIVNLYTTIARNADGSSFTPKPGTGKGYDFGVKADMFKGIFSGVLSLYSLEEADIVRILPPVTVAGETFNPSEQSGINRSQGVEVDLTARPGKGTQLGLGYAYTDAIVKSDNSNGAAIVIGGVRYLTRQGHQLQYSPHHQISGNLRQDLGSFGFFRNLYVLADARWVDVRQYTEAWIVKNNVLSPPFTLDAYSLVNVGVGAEFEVGHAKCDASFRMKNVFDERYFYTRNYYGAPRTIEFSLRTHF